MRGHAMDVIAGLEPAIQSSREKMDGRVKPGHDGGEDMR
jgi:hypothetical protein